MLRRLVVCFLVSFAAIASLGARALAQSSKTDVRARVDRLAAEVEKLAAAAAETGTLSQALAEVSAELVRLRARLDELERRGGSGAGEQVSARMDELDARLDELQHQVSSLRASVQAGGAPETQSPAGGVSYDDGFLFATADGRFSLRAKAYAQLRFVLRTDEVASTVDEASALLRRARPRWDGHIYSKDLRYRIELELGRGRAELLDFWVEGELGPVTIRGGQMKAPFTRSFIGADDTLSFPERSVATDEFRYDRDIGATVSGRFAGDRVEALVGVFNGAGPNVPANDNIDPLLVARFAVTPFGAPVSSEEGDIDDRKGPGLAIGVGGTFENAPVTEIRDGFNTDVDGDGLRDNVRVVQLGVDLAFKWRGLAIEGEWYLRKESWGTIGMAQNPPLVPDEDYRGWSAQASYFVIPAHFQIGARFSFTEISPLAIGGKPRTVELFDERREFSAIAGYYHFRHGVKMRAMWSFLDWGNEETADPVGRGEQRFIVEAQVGF